jgi:O-antigen/teichoic acid export membrane protein
VNNTADRNILDKFVLRTGMLSLARIIQVLCTLAVFWLCSVQLDRSVYGVYQKIFVLIGFCSSLLALGLPLLIASLPATQLEFLIRSIWKKTFKTYLILSAAIAVFILFFLPVLSLPVRYLLLALTLTSATYSVAEITTIKRGENRLVFLINVFYACGFAGIHYYFLFRAAFSLEGLLSALTALGILRIAFTGIWRKNAPPAGADSAPYTRQWLYLSLNQGLESLSGNIDNLFLLWLLTAPLFAVYFNGSYEIPLSGILVSAAGTFISVQINQHDTDHAGILSLFHRVCLLMACLLFPLFFFVQANAGWLFSRVFQGKYDDSVQIFLIASWILPLRVANYTVLLQNKLRSQRIFQGSLLGVIAKIIFCLAGYALYGVRGVAAAMVAGTGVQIIFYLYYSARALDTKIYSVIPFRKLIVFFLLCGVLFLGGQWCVAQFLPGSGILYPALLLVALSAVSLAVYYPQARKGLTAKTGS